MDVADGRHSIRMRPTRETDRRAAIHAPHRRQRAERFLGNRDIMVATTSPRG
jgi:hypothetical protein